MNFLDYASGYQSNPLLTHRVVNNPSSSGLPKAYLLVALANEEWDGRQESML